MPAESYLQNRKSPTPFAARGFTPKVDIDPRSNGSNQQHTVKKTQQFTNISTELTRNSNYVVSKLSATPSALKNNDSFRYEGLLDETTGHGLLVSSESINIWSYNSVDSIPTTIQLPVVPSNNGFHPISLFVSPSAGSTEPGVIVINTHTGHIRLYENVHSASSVGLLQLHKGIDFLLKLSDREVITICKSIEPAGILISTNQGRLVLLSLRDSTGKPLIRASEVVRRQVGFFSTSLELSRQFVSIQPGASTGQGERVAATVKRNGDFQVWLCASDGQSKLTFQYQLAPLLLSSISELYPNAARSLEVLDLSLLTNFENEDVFLLLTSFENSPGEFYYVLFTIKKEGDQLLVFSAYKLNTYTKKYETTPKLYVPSPHTTAFVVFDNAIVLTELVSKLDYNLNLRRKWEDIITFRNDVNIIGSGLQNMDSTNDEITQLPSVLAIIPDFGVLRVDRLKPKALTEQESVVTPFLKSHIEQAVFYGEDQQNPIEFDLPENLILEPSEIETDLLEAADEILLSHSPYLPPRLLSIESHLALRKQKLEKLLDYTAVNFKDKISDNAKFVLISVLEKITAAYNLQKVIAKYSEDPAILSIFERAFKTFTGSTKTNEFFTNGLHKLNALLTTIITQINETSNQEDLVAEVVSVIYSGVLEIVKKYRFEVFELDAAKSGVEQFWFTTNEVSLLIDEIFQKFANVHRSDTKETSLTTTAVDLCEILFYQSQQALVWLRNQSPKTREIQDNINRLQAFYEAKSGTWTKTLVLFGSRAEALAIAETYQDLKSLVEISDADRESSEGEELDRVLMRFNYYFNKFQYQFAETLYRYYIYSGNYEALLLEFTQYSEYLKRFFSENNYGKISWIKDIFDLEYTKASKALLEVSQKSEGSVRNRNVQLSIAKLSALASIDDQDNVQPEVNDLLNDIQDELNFVDAQGAIFEQIHEFIRSDSDPTAQIDAVVKDLLKQDYNSAQFKLVKKSFERSLARLLQNKSLTVNELVDIFTLLAGSKTQNKSNYFYALKVLHLSTLSESDKIVNEKLIWKRAILSDDWKNIIGSDNKSDAFIQESIQGTTVFETLVNFFTDGLYINNNDYSISLPDIKKLVEIDDDSVLLSRFHFVTEGELDQFKNEIKAENDSILELYSYGEFDQWLKALIGAANEQSGQNKVINYNTMTIEGL